MYYFIDLDDTLVNTTILNNDAYNFALEKFGFPRIETNKRITNNEMIVIYENDLSIINNNYKIVNFIKRKYFNVKGFLVRYNN